MAYSKTFILALSALLILGINFNILLRRVNEYETHTLTSSIFVSKPPFMV